MTTSLDVTGVKEGICVEFKRKKNKTFSCFQNVREYWIYFMTDPLNICFDHFGVWLLDYMIEFSCLYTPQGHYFISTFVTMEYIQLCYFFILSKAPPLMFPFVGWPLAIGNFWQYCINTIYHRYTARLLHCYSTVHCTKLFNNIKQS